MRPGDVDWSWSTDTQSPAFVTEGTFWCGMGPLTRHGLRVAWNRAEMGGLDRQADRMD